MRRPWLALVAPLAWSMLGHVHAQTTSAAKPIVRGDLVVDLRPDLPENAPAWTNHAQWPLTVGDFRTVGGQPLDVVSTDGPAGPARVVRFNAKSAGVLVSQRNAPDDITLGQSVSVEIWMRVNTIAPNMALLTYGIHESGRQRLFLYGEERPFSGHSTDVRSWGSHRLDTGVWHHLAWTFDPASTRRLQVYVDGKPVSGGKVALKTEQGTPIVLGAAGSEENHALWNRLLLDGEIASVRVMTGVLSDDDVRQNFLASGGTPAATRPAARTPEDAQTPLPCDSPRHRQFVQRLAAGPVGVLFFGDGLIAEWPQTGESSWNQLGPLKPVNFGIHAQTTQHLLWRMQNGELDNTRPKVLVLQVGHNNLNDIGGDQPAWAAAAVKKILALVQQKLPDTPVLLLGIPPRGEKDSPERAAIAQYNDLLRAFDDAATVRYLDPAPIFLDDTGDLIPDLSPDKKHLSSEGYQRWYNAMQPLLQKMLAQ